MLGRVWTLPNLISAIRLALVPVFLWLCWRPDPDLVAAAVLLGFLGATDWVDGWIARRWDQGSELGKILDPTADRVLLVAGAVALLTLDVPAPVRVLLVVVLVREVAIAAVTVSLAVAGARRIDVVWAGKAGTLAVMFALPAFLLADAADGAASVVFSIIGWGFAIGGIGLGYYAAVRYIPEARLALAEGRAARAAAEPAT